MEIEALLIGTWKNIEDLEECLTLDELHQILAANRKIEDDRAKWLAAVNGIDLSDDGTRETPQETVDRLKRKAEAMEEGGMTEDEFEFGQFGISVVSD